MKDLFIDLTCAVAVAVGFIAAAHVDGSFILEWLAFTASVFVLKLFYVQRWPRTASLKWAMQLKPNQKIEVEGK